MGFGISELIIILLIVGLLFGTKKLRNIGGDLGSAIKSFRGAVKEPEDKEPSLQTNLEQSSGNVIEGEIETKKSEGASKTE